MVSSNVIYRRAAFYVDRILRGEKAGDLPFQLPTSYDLVISSGKARPTKNDAKSDDNRVYRLTAIPGLVDPY